MSQQPPLGWNPPPPQGPWQPHGQGQQLSQPLQSNTGYQQSSGPQWPPQQSGMYPSQQPMPQGGYPPSQWQQPPMMPPGAPMQPPRPPVKKLSRRTWIILGVIVLILVIISVVSNAGKSMETPVATAPTATAIIVNSQATDTPIPMATAIPQVVHYPPTTEADLRGLAAQGDVSAIHEFHSESAGLVGACPEPKREVTVDPSVTGRQLAEDLLAYFYGQQIDSPCGSIVFAYHTQAEVNDPNSTGYTAGRILFQVTDSSGAINLDPNASNLTNTLTLDIGGNLTGQEYVTTY